MFGWLAVFHLFILLVALSFNPTKAFADTYIGGPYENVNDAGLTYLGYDYDDLETESTHTALNELVEFPNKYPDYTFWVDSFYEQFDPLNLNPGYYWSKYDGMIFVDLTDRARADVVKAVKAAEDYNNSSGAVQGDYLVFTVPILYLKQGFTGSSGYMLNLDTSNAYLTNFVNNATGDGSSASKRALMSQLLEVRVPLSNFAERPVETDLYFIRFSTGNYRLTLSIYKSTSDTVVEKKPNATYTTEYNGNSYNSYVNVLKATKLYITANVIVNQSDVSYSDGVITVSGSRNITFGTSYNTIDNTAIGSYGLPTNGLYYGYSGALPKPPDEPTEPDEPTTTPELPETPTAPDLPDPDLPTEPDVPESLDLSDLLAALDEHCQHIQLAIYNGLDDYYTSITKYYEDVVKWLADTYKYYDNELDKRFQVLFNFLRSTNQYLKNIDDNVQEILDKLDGLGEQIGLGDIPDSYDNNNVATDGSSALSNAYNTIRNKFPFSVLDNLLTLVTSLKHDAVAPVVSLPVGNPFDSEPYMVEMDFSDWSDLAAIVRTGELVVAYLGMSKSAIKMWTGGEGEAE